MVLTKKSQEITRQDILDKIGSHQIYQQELGEHKVGKAFCNPLRKDRVPSMSLFTGDDGHLRHIDYACSDTYKGDCIALVSQKYGITYREAINKLAKDWGLLNGTYEVRKIEIVQNSLKMPKKHALIQGTVKKFNKRELNDYWGRYVVIGEEKLKRHNVYSMKEVFLNRKKIPIGKEEMVFGYWYEGIGWKVMFPERDKLHKWLSSIPMDTAVGLENLSKDHNALIIKSLKCYMVMEEVYQYLAYMQNESLGSISDKSAEYINENSDKVFYGGDSDCAGKKASYRITEKHHWYHINTPDILLPNTKDWSDWAKEAQSLEPIRQHLITKGVII